MQILCKMPEGTKRGTWPLRQRTGILPLMNDHRPEPGPDDYLLLPSVTHPGGRERAFKDAYKAMVRFMIEVNDNPCRSWLTAPTNRRVSFSLSSKTFERGGRMATLTTPNSGFETNASPAGSSSSFLPSPRKSAAYSSSASLFCMKIRVEMFWRTDAALNEKSLMDWLLISSRIPYLRPSPQYIRPKAAF